LIGIFVVIGFAAYLLSSHSPSITPVTFPNWKTDGTYIYYGNTLRGVPDRLIGGSDASTFKALSNEFAQDKNWIYGVGSPILDVDRESFKIISGYYALDKNHIYFQSNPIPEADPLTFKILYTDKSIARDKSFVYRGNTVIKGANPDTFSPIGTTYYWKDENGIYVPSHFPSQFLGNGEVTILGKPYIGLGNKVLYQGDEVTPAPDLKTFKELSAYYAIDAQHAYYQTRQIPDTDSSTFELINTVWGTQQGVYHQYAKDKNGVYASGQRIAGLDPKTTEILSENYVKDAANVYFVSAKIEGADPGTFTIVGGADSPYALDKNGLWVRDVRLPISNPSEFRDIGNGYGSDGTSVYYFDHILPDSDLKTFRIMKTNYLSMDKKNVYFAENLLSSDAPHFYILQDDYSKDSSNIYLGGMKIEGADVDSFVYLQRQYSKDKNTVFYQQQPIDGADVATFGYDHYDPAKGFIYKDKNSSYVWGKPIAI